MNSNCLHACQGIVIQRDTGHKSRYVSHHIKIMLLIALYVLQTYLNRLILEDRDRQIDEVRRKYENDEDRSQEEVMRIEQETVSLEGNLNASLFKKPFLVEERHCRLIPYVHNVFVKYTYTHAQSHTHVYLPVLKFICTYTFFLYIQF